jgi:hypothetical protein
LLAAGIYLFGRIAGKLVSLKIGGRIVGLGREVENYLGYILLGHSAFASFFVYFVGNEVSRSGQEFLVYGNLGLVQVLSAVIIGATIVNDLIAALVGPLALRGDRPFMMDQKAGLVLESGLSHEK